MATKKPLKLSLDPTKTSLLDARNAIKPHVLGVGVICPCCNQLVRIIQKDLTGSIVYVAILLHRHFVEDQNWLHVADYLSTMAKIGSAVRGGEWSKLRYWGLLEAKPDGVKVDAKDASKRSGYYRMTEKGHQFVRGEIKIPKSIMLYNDQHLGFGKEEVTVQEALGKEFNYSELMAGNLGLVV